MMNHFYRKASICIFFSAFVFISHDSTAQKIADDGTQLIEVPFTTVPPAIDGTVNADEWNGAGSNTVDFINLGVANAGTDIAQDPEDLSFTFHVLYDDDFLYIGVDVTDDAYVYTNYGRDQRFDLNVTWNNDSVEYFFDGDNSLTTGNSRNPTDSETGGQWIFGRGIFDDTPLPFVTAEQQGLSRPYGTEADDVWFALTEINEQTADWSQEARFKLDILGSPSPGDSIGFNIVVSDVDVEDPLTLAGDDFFTENRELQLWWTVFGFAAGETAPGAPHQEEDKWGTMHFLESTTIQEWSVF